MSTLVSTPFLGDAKTGAECCHRPLQQQQRGLCLGSTSPQQLAICAIPLGSSPLCLRRGSVRGSKLTRRSLQAGPRADSETEERPSRPEGNGKRGLDELDNQLRSLSTSDNVMSAGKEQSKGDENMRSREERKVDWPVFGDGFVLYIAVGFVLLTIINNILFKVFLGSPVPRDLTRSQETEVPQASQGSGETEATQSPRERYKLRSYNDPKYYTNVPQVTDEPVF